MAAMGVMYLRRMKVERYRHEHPEEFSEELHTEDEEMEAYMRSYHLDTVYGRKESKPPPTPPKKTLPVEAKRAQTKYRQPEKPAFSTSMAAYRKASDAESRTYEVEYLNRETRARALLKQLSSPQDLILLKEILGPPKSMQKSWGDPMGVFNERP